MEYVSKVFRFLVNYSYYGGGSLPFYWNDEKGEGEVVRSKWRKFMSCLNLLFVTMVVIAQGIGLVQGFTVHNIPITSTVMLLRLISTLFCIFCIIAQFNSLWKPEEVMGCVNQILRLGPKLHQQNIIPAHHKIYKFFQKFSNVFILGGVLLQAQVIGIYLIMCDLHFFGSILPSCPLPEESIIIKVIRYTLFSLLGAVVVVQLYAPILFHVLCITLGVLVGTEMIHLLARPKQELMETDSPLASPRTWLKFYNSLYLFNANTNRSLCVFYVPTGILAAGIILVVLSYALLVIDLDVLTRGTIFVIFLLFGTFFILVVQRASGGKGWCEEAISSRKSIPEFLTPINYRRLKSCPLILVAFGPFFYFSVETVPNMAMTVLDYTVEAVITFPV